MLAAISIGTVAEHIQHDHAIVGLCASHGTRTIDLHAMVAAGYGDVALSDLVRRADGERVRGVPRLTCRQCGEPLSLSRCPPTTGVLYGASKY